MCLYIFVSKFVYVLIYLHLNTYVCKCVYDFVYTCISMCTWIYQYLHGCRCISKHLHPDINYENLAFALEPKYPQNFFLNALRSKLFKNSHELCAANEAYTLSRLKSDASKWTRRFSASVPELICDMLLSPLTHFPVFTSFVSIMILGNGILVNHYYYLNLCCGRFLVVFSLFNRIINIIRIIIAIIVIIIIIIIVVVTKGINTIITFLFYL